MRSWADLLRLFHRVWDWFDNRSRIKEQEQAQEARDAIEENPNAWFDKHFGFGDGVPSSSNKESDATDADKTDPRKDHD